MADAPAVHGESSLAIRILQTLAGEPEAVSLPWLGKRLSQSASVLMRQLTLMGAASIGGQAGPGWVDVRQHEGRWMVQLTPQGRLVAQSGADGVCNGDTA